MNTRIKKVLATVVSSALISGAVLTETVQKAYASDVDPLKIGDNSSSDGTPRALSYPWHFSKRVNYRRVVGFAKEYVGARYVYGASGPRSFDCSGFTMYVMAQFGIKLPHSARSQSSYGSRIARGDLRPADLVFFATSGGGKISHVGIYVGDGCFIHASSGSGGVKIDSLSEGYYNRRYVTAVRLFR